MKTIADETGGVLVTSLMVGMLLTVLGGLAMSSAWTEMQMGERHKEETSSRMLAESGIEEVIGLFTVPPSSSADVRQIFSTVVFRGSAVAPDVDFNATRPEDDRVLNDRSTGLFRSLGALGSITRFRVYGSPRPDGVCTIEMTAESTEKVQRSISLELGATRIPGLQAAIQTGRAVEGASSNPALKIWAHWGAILLAGDPDLGSSTEFPRRFDHAPVTGFGYGESGGVLEDRWMEAWIGGTPRFDEAGAVVPSNVHSDQDPVPGLPQDPWSYQKFKDLAMRFGTYYVPDREGRLYRNGKMEPSLALTASEVFRSAAAGDDRGLIFVDTLDRQAPSENNLTTLIIESPYIEGVLYANAHLRFTQSGRGQPIAVSSPLIEQAGSPPVRVPVTLTDVAIQGVVHAAGTIYVDGQLRIFGALVAQGGVTGRGVLEVWYNDDLHRGFIQGLPVVFPLKGTWREWGS